MRILHTSDWHVGRTFHGHSTLAALREVLGALVDIVRTQRVDVVLVAGDIFDSASPAADNYTVLTDALRDIRSAGATVIMTSGNHDSATRLGFQSEFAQLAGIHIVTREEQHLEPITLQDDAGPVHIYGIPYLEPSLIRHRYPQEQLRTHTQVLGFVMDRIRADAAERGGRSVVMSHSFVVGVEEPAASDVVGDADGSAAVTALPPERDITAGGLDFVPLSVFSKTVFDGPEYVALGHIHGRSTLAPNVRYSGAPLHYSFSEAGKPRGGWLVDLGPAGTDASISWVDLPVPRRLTVLTGTLDELLTDDAHADNEQDWIAAQLTDQVRPLDGMRRLQKRFPYCVTLEHRPTIVADAGTQSYTQRVAAKSDAEIVDGFLSFVRNGVGASDYERGVVSELLTDEDLAS